MAFLDIGLTHQADGSVGHSVYRKPMHTNLYLPHDIFNHLAQRMSGNTFNQELDFLKDIFIRHGFNQNEICRVINRGQSKSVREEEIKGVAVIPFCGSTSNRMTRILAHHNIKTVTRPFLKIKDLMRLVKDPLGLHVPGVYQIPCACGKVFVGQTGRTITIRE